MIKNKDLAKELDIVLKGVCLALDESAALVRKRSEEEAAAYAAAIAKIFLCIYSEILDPLYCDHPDLAPALWERDN
jgi:hypothetical protein